MNDRVVIVVQARMSSSRLPGKVLMQLAGRPSLVRLMERISRSKRADECLVATSEDDSDDPVAEACQREGIRCVRGSLANVLSRYHKAARTADAGVVVRVTGDCPLHDPLVIDDSIDLFARERAQLSYVSNVDERTYPDGLDVEVMDFTSLDEAERRATSKWDREHVTPYIRRHMRKRTLSQEVDLQDLRWTLDYADDYAAIGEIYNELVGSDRLASFTTTDVYRLLLVRPDLIRTAARRVLTGTELDDIRVRIQEQVRLNDERLR